jgi:hypothetical protein
MFPRSLIFGLPPPVDMSDKLSGVKSYSCVLSNASCSATLPGFGACGGFAEEELGAAGVGDGVEATGEFEFRVLRVGLAGGLMKSW